MKVQFCGCNKIIKTLGSFKSYVITYIYLHISVKNESGNYTSCRKDIKFLDSENSFMYIIGM